MKKIFVLLFLIPLVTFCFADGTAQISDEQISRFDSYLDEITEAYHIPGMAFFITDSEKTIFSKTFGQCVSMDQNFFVGSISKSYTALSVMRLVEMGLINLDDDISVYLPEYSFPKKVSVLSLLNHTSGFNTHAKLHNAKITGSYGKYEYANVNYDLLGKIVEKVSGKSFAEYVQENIFTPIGMSKSQADAKKMKGDKNLLLGNRNFFGIFVTGDADYPNEKSWFHEPAGFMNLTPNDHAKYLRMYLNGGITEQGERIVKKETIDSMWYENVPIGSDNAFYGRGWNYMEHDGMKIVFHGGQVENYISYMFILPEKNLAVCFMVNGNDEFGMNELMDNAFWDSLSILKGGEPKKVGHSKYVLIHTALDLAYLLVIMFSVFLLIKAFRGNRKKYGKGGVRKIILAVLGYVVWPLLILFCTQIFFETPLWVVKSYVPDLYLTILTGSALSIFGGAVKIAKVLGKKK